MFRTVVTGGRLFLVLSVLGLCLCSREARSQQPAEQILGLWETQQVLPSGDTLAVRALFKSVPAGLGEPNFYLGVYLNGQHVSGSWGFHRLEFGVLETTLYTTAPDKRKLEGPTSTELLQFRGPDSFVVSQGNEEITFYRVRD